MTALLAWPVSGPPGTAAGPGAGTRLLRSRSASRGQGHGTNLLRRCSDVGVVARRTTVGNAESHDSASREIRVKKSSSRWADRPVPVLQVEFPEPWSIIAAARPVAATGAKCAGNMKWSRLASLMRTYFQEHYPKS